MTQKTETILLALLQQDETVPSQQIQQLLAILHNQVVENDQFYTQSTVAKKLEVDRVTVWRMTKEGKLTPVELKPGLWRYPAQQIQALANAVQKGPNIHNRKP